MATRRRPQLKWQPLAPPTPRVLNLPRRHVRRLKTMAAGVTGGVSGNKRGTTRLEALFDEERAFGKDGAKMAYDVPVVLLNAGGERLRRERVAEEEEEEDGREVAGVEAEMLRAECRFLRMERELALKKVKRNRARMEKVLRSALQTLISGRDKVAAEGVNVYESLDEEIEAMRSKLVDLQRVSGTKLFEAHQRSSSAFDDQDSNFPSRFVLDGNPVPREIQELVEASFSIHAGSTNEGSFEGSNRFTDMELLRSRMEEANGSMTLYKIGNSVASSACTSWQTEMPDLASSYSIRQGYQEGMGEEEKPCSGRCRAVLRRIAEQVRIETEQWSQVLEMLEKVREEMEQLQGSRDMWEQQALVSKNQILSLNSTVEAWKKEALSAEAKVNDLQTQVQVLQEELKMARTNCPSPTSTQNAGEKEKRVLICQFKENQHLKNGNNRRHGDLREEKKQLGVHKRSPFRDIGNSSPLMRQITNVVFPGHRR